MGHTLSDPYLDKRGQPWFVVLGKETSKTIASSRNGKIAEMVRGNWGKLGGVYKPALF